MDIKVKLENMFQKKTWGVTCISRVLVGEEELGKVVVGCSRESTV